MTTKEMLDLSFDKLLREMRAKREIYLLKKNKSVQTFCCSRCGFSYEEDFVIIPEWYKLGSRNRLCLECYEKVKKRTHR